MSAFVKLGDIKGQSTDTKHKDWIMVDSFSSPIFRSIAPSARDQQRAQGETTLGDIVCVKKMDKSSTKLSEACAKGQFFSEVEVHYCSDIDNKSEPVYEVKLKNVIITSYSLHVSASNVPEPSEQFSMNFSEVEWNYNLLNPNTGKKEGNVPGTYVPGKAATK